MEADFFQVTYIFRESNQVANYMANWALPGDFSLTAMTTLDFGCTSLLQADAYGVRIYICTPFVSLHLSSKLCYLTIYLTAHSIFLTFCIALDGCGAAKLGFHDYRTT